MLTEPRAPGARVVAPVVCASGLHASLRVRGDLDAEVATHLASELDRLIASGVLEITIDLGPMAFIGSAAHRVVADAAARLDDLGGRLAVARSAA